MSDAAIDARKAALTALFDDASTFPPVRRDLTAALAAHAVIVAGPHTWIAARFMVTSDLATELAARLAEGPDGERLDVAVVLPRSGVGSLPPVVRADLARLRPLGGDSRVRVRALEMSLSGPDPLADVPEVIAGALAAGLDHVTALACEIPLAGRPPGEVVRRINAIADARDDGLPLLAKLRLAGTIAGTAPTEVEVAGFLRACADAELPIKVTMGAARAGRTRNQGTGDVEHGFLSVLGAAALAYRGAVLGEIREAVEQPVEQIRLGPGALIVGGAVLDSDVLADTRRDFLHAISCADLDEPVRELVALGALEASEARP